MAETMRILQALDLNVIAALDVACSRLVAAAFGKDLYYRFSETRQVSPIIPDKPYVPWIARRENEEWFAQ
jgi:hypothetical protein